MFGLKRIVIGNWTIAAPENKTSVASVHITGEVISTPFNKSLVGKKLSFNANIFHEGTEPGAFMYQDRYYILDNAESRINEINEVIGLISKRALSSVQPIFLPNSNVFSIARDDEFEHIKMPKAEADYIGNKVMTITLDWFPKEIHQKMFTYNDGKYDLFEGKASFELSYNGLLIKTIAPKLKEGELLMISDHGCQVFINKDQHRVQLNNDVEGMYDNLLNEIYSNMKWDAEFKALIVRYDNKSFECIRAIFCISYEKKEVVEVDVKHLPLVCGDELTKALKETGHKLI